MGAGRRVLVPHLAQAPARPPRGARLLQASGLTMGTSWTVKWVVPAAAGNGEVRDEAHGSAGGGAQHDLPAGIQAGLDTVVRQMSSWEPESDLSRFNRAPAGTSFTLPAEFARVLDHALAVARDSDGAFDATAGALVDAWGFGAGDGYRQRGFALPTDAALAAARAASGWRLLEFDAAARTVVQPGGVRLDLSAIAKGFAVDQVARYLQSRGIDDYLVEVGGELRGAGVKPDGQPWWVMLEAPPAEKPDAAGSLVETVVALHGLSVATSGDYRRYVDRDGARHCHAIDPRTGRPVAAGVASVTVLHRDCMAADALSTALMVMELEQGIEWAQRRGIAALFRLRPVQQGGAGGSHGAWNGRGAREALHERMTAPFAALLQ